MSKSELYEKGVAMRQQLRSPEDFEKNAAE